MNVVSYPRRAAAWLGLAALTLLMAIPAPVAAQEIARISAGEREIVWKPTVEYRQITLTVSGGGRQFQETFEAPREPALALVDERGKSLPDGTYKYELSLVPRTDGPTLAEQARVRESGDPNALIRMAQKLEPRAATSQSGTFSVRGGALADLALAEKSANPEREEREGDFLISGDLQVAGKKSFVMKDPEDPGVAIHFVALEGPEAGTYFRATGRLVDGQAVIELPEHFVRATEPEGLTVQLTPIGAWSRLYVASKSLERLVVRSAEGAPEIEFDVLVHGVRKGFAGHQPLRRAAESGG